MSTVKASSSSRRRTLVEEESSEDESEPKHVRNKSRQRDTKAEDLDVIKTRSGKVIRRDPITVPSDSDVDDSSGDEGDEDSTHEEAIKTLSRSKVKSAVRQRSRRKNGTVEEDAENEDELLMTRRSNERSGNHSIQTSAKKSSPLAYEKEDVIVLDDSDEEVMKETPINVSIRSGGEGKRAPGRPIKRKRRIVKSSSSESDSASEQQSPATTKITKRKLQFVESDDDKESAVNVGDESASPVQESSSTYLPAGYSTKNSTTFSFACPSNYLSPVSKHDSIPLTSNIRIFLNVPYEARTQAQDLGAKYERERRLYYVPPGIPLRPFEQWFEADINDSEDISPERKIRPRKDSEDESGDDEIDDDLDDFIVDDEDFEDDDDLNEDDESIKSASKIATNKQHSSSSSRFKRRASSASYSSESDPESDRENEEEGSQTDASENENEDPAGDSSSGTESEPPDEMFQRNQELLEESKASTPQRSQQPKGYLYCSPCGQYYPHDSFSQKQAKVANDQSRYCLRHSTTSAFNQSAVLRVTKEIVDTDEEEDELDD